MGVTRNTYRFFLLESLKRRDILVDLGVGQRIILKS